MFERTFKDRARHPTDEDLASYCGQYAKPLLNLIHQFSDDSEWKLYSKKAGWTKKYIFKKKSLCFIQPSEKKIECIFNLNSNDEKTIQESSHFPKEIIAEIKQLKKYAEGKSYRFIIEDDFRFELAKKLLQLKTGRDIHPVSNK